MKLRDRVAIITGGGRGIGKATALLFAKEGANVCVAARTAKEIEAVKEEIVAGGGQAIAVQTDVSKAEDANRMVASTIDAYGKLDILVCAAGVLAVGEIQSHDDKEWQRVLDINLTGVYLCNKAAIAPMIKNRWGRIINVSSTSGNYGGAGEGAYCASKHGVLGLVKCLALEVADKGITVNAICPGWVWTKMAEELGEIEARAQGISVNQYWQEVRATNPQHRILEAREVAHLMLYIASEEAKGLTGQAITLTAGSLW